MKFNSQVATSRVQSERLLALGLKKETADMCHFWHWASDDYSLLSASWERVHRSNKDIPAWSLHRLIEMGFNSLALLEDADDEDEIFFMAYKNPFESMLEMFEQAIKEGYFNKEYLV